jgi:ABC-type tungstate transport system substrate-binding protein
MKGLFGPRAFVSAGGLALVNVVLPLLVLRLVVGRRRVFRMWALMVVPVAAVVPLMVYLSLAPWLPVGEQRWLATEQRVFLAGTLAGVPVVLGAWCVLAAVVRRRWRRIAGMIGLVTLATLLVAGVWIWLDRKSMAAIERYGWEGWELVVLAGAYGAAVLWGLGCMTLGAYRLVRRRRT